MNNLGAELFGEFRQTERFLGFLPDYFCAPVQFIIQGDFASNRRHAKFLVEMPDHQGEDDRAAHEK